MRRCEAPQDYPQICDVATKCSAASWTGPNGWRPSRKRPCSTDNTSVTLSRAISCRADTTYSTRSSDTYKFFTEANGCRSSSHCVFSISLCQCGRVSRSPRMMLRRSKREMGPGGQELQICAREESCHSDTLHEIPTVSSGQ